MKIRKPKMKKLPKRPPKSASVDAKANYLKKVAAVKKENKAAEARYKKAVAVVKSMRKKNEILEKKISQAIAGFKK